MVVLFHCPTIRTRLRGYKYTGCSDARKILHAHDKYLHQTNVRAKVPCFLRARREFAMREYGALRPSRATRVHHASVYIYLISEAAQQ